MSNTSAESGVIEAQKPMRCLVIQLTRLGDTLQSLMALRAAKQLYPGLEIHFLARERFAAAAKRVPWISQVITLPTDDLLGPVLNGKKTETQALRELAKWAAPLVKEPWDMVVNWSYSESSSFLAGLMPARIKLGFTRRKDLSLSCADGWSHYIQGIIQGSIDQNIHLTDVLTTQLLTALQIHVGEPADNGNSPVTSKSFFALEMTEKDMGWSWRDITKKWIAIQLGAGSDAKTWSPENWARVTSSILRRHPECSIVLLGGREDLPRARRFLAEADTLKLDRRNIISLVGETDFDLWASVVSSCQWVFSCDTAAIHLASVLGTRVLNVSVGPVRPAETGPYGNGHYVISTNRPCAGCDNRFVSAEHTCRDSVDPDAVYAAWSYASSEWAHRRQNPIEGHFAQLGMSHLLDGIRVSRSKIRNTNDGGGVVYEPMIHRALPLRDWTSMVMGHMARSWYCGWVPPVAQELKREMIAPSLIQKLRELDESTQVLSKICDEAVRTAISLNRRSSRLKSDKVMGLNERDELRDLAKKLMELEGLVDRLGKTHEPLAAFSQMSKVLMHNLRGSQLAELGKETAMSYRQLAEGVTILREWIKQTLAMARPVALSVVPGSKGRELST